MKYFEIDTGKKITEDFLKGQWRKIAVRVHPDKNGTHEAYIEAQDEYDSLLKQIGSTFTAKEDSVEHYGSFESFYANISPVIKEAYEQTAEIVPTDSIEVCGQWIWVDLDKDDVDTRTKLKEIDIDGKKYRFARKKLKWYFAGKRSFNRGTWNMNEIRVYHGSQKFQQKALA